MIVTRVEFDHSFDMMSVNVRSNTTTNTRQTDMNSDFISFCFVLIKTLKTLAKGVDNNALFEVYHSETKNLKMNFVAKSFKIIIIL